MALLGRAKRSLYRERLLSNALISEITIFRGRDTDTDPEQRIKSAAHVSSPVPAEHKPVEIALQMAFPEAVEHAFRPPLQVGKLAVNPVQDLVRLLAADDLDLMAGVSITRTELTAPELCLAAGRTKDAGASRRMLAIALVLEGMDRTIAARTCGMDRQTLRDWVHRYNADGLAGLSNRRGTGRPRRLTPEQMTELAGWVEAGPDPEQDGVVRWRRNEPDRVYRRRWSLSLSGNLISLHA